LLMRELWEKIESGGKRGSYSMSLFSGWWANMTSLLGFS
jgi:hypothetical protein